MSKKYHVSPQELQRRLNQQKRDLSANKPKKTIEPQYLQGVQGSVMQFGFWVHNWRHGWKWLSNYFFGAIAYIAFFGLPPEVIALFPEDSQKTIMGVLAGLGIFFRFVNQNKPEPLPPASDKEDA